MIPGSLGRFFLPVALLDAVRDRCRRGDDAASPAGVTVLGVAPPDAAYELRKGSKNLAYMMKRGGGCINTCRGIRF